MGSALVCELVRLWCGFSVLSLFPPTEGRRCVLPAVAGVFCVVCGPGASGPFAATFSARRAAFSSAFCFLSWAGVSFVPAPATSEPVGVADAVAFLTAATGLFD